MALIKCPECGKEVSDQSKICVHCGYRIRKWAKKNRLSNGDNIFPQITINKKGIGIIGIAIFVVGILCILNHTHVICLRHEYSEATCSEPATCCYCGKVKGNLLEHQWLNATCDTAKRCSLCGKVDGKPSGHKWKKATYTEPQKCTKCGETKEKTLKQVEEEQVQSMYDELLEMAKGAVKERLKAPATAIFSDIEMDSAAMNGFTWYYIEGAVDAENGFGALIRSRFKVTIGLSELFEEPKIEVEFSK